MPNRRERARATTVAQIKRAALEQVATEGAAALSIRGVARAIGMSPAGLYRYYDGRDALLTDLLVDAYRDLAAAVAAAAGLPLAEPPGGTAADVLAAPPPLDDPVAALLRAISAYRAWAVAEPNRFLLIFGTPVPGYQAPADGPTVAANRAMGRVFFTLAALAWGDGRVAAPPPERRPTTAEETALLDQLHALAPDLPAGLVPRMLGGWALWHGLVTLEVTGQLHWIYPDTAAFYDDRVRAWVAAFCAGRA
ncbi:MAG: TetR/AcrR family transcriptional regulator [Candidatus Nanopelagicales bacterium]|jgi:AcrR family transcriptional regulator|nr:TetR/AcrR family transcriptional regulator [Candidatus Nanopelagicales bacterium]